MKIVKTHNWCLKLRDGFKNQFNQLDKKTRKTAFRQIQQLLEAENPLSVPKVLKLKNAVDLYRVRIGNFRLLFSLEVAMSSAKIILLRTSYGLNKSQTARMFIENWTK